MIEPVKEVLDRFADNEGWDADTREHVLLQFLANHEGGPGAAAEDLNAFLTDLLEGEEEAAPDPRAACYAHLEQLEAMLTAGAYEPSAENWARLERLLARTLAEATAAGLLESQPPPPGDRPRYYVAVSLPLPDRRMGLLPRALEQTFKAALDGTVGTAYDGTGSGMGFREFFATTTEPGAVAADLGPLLPAEGQLAFRRLPPGDPGDPEEDRGA